MDADSILEKWRDCLNDNNINGITDLYAEHAILWGTFSTTLRDTPELIKEYFIELFKRDNVKVNFGDSENRQYSDVYIYCGAYEFSYIEEEKIILPSRYTFIVHKNTCGEYKIVEHHSSLMPSLYAKW